MELSLLCEVKVLLCIVDKNKKLLVYCSDDAVSLSMQQSITNDNIQKEYLTNDDVFYLIQSYFQYKDLFSEILLLDENEEGSLRQENSKEKNLKEEEDKKEIVTNQKEAVGLINSCKVNIASQNKKRNDTLESRSRILLRI